MTQFIEHSPLNKRVKAQFMDIEVAWGFFAIHTTNAVRLARKIYKKKTKSAHQPRAA